MQETNQALASVKLTLSNGICSLLLDDAVRTHSPESSMLNDVGPRS